ncbi:MAG: hypothetical protein V7636_1500 [Actinomycetota bacterium]
MARLEVEATAIALAGDGGIPVPTVLWQEANVLALGALPGAQLGRLGDASSASSASWSAAGEVAARMHALPLPPWTGADVDGVRAFVDGECRWLVDNEIAPADVVTRVRRVGEPGLRSRPPVFSHGDFQAAHVLVDGDTVTGIIDWSDCAQGAPEWDLAILTVGHGEHLDDVLRGYGADVDRDVIRANWALRRLCAIRWMIEHEFDATGDIAMLHTTAKDG